MRIKEDAHDYRYFPDPDLLPVDTRVFMDEVRALRPELPDEKRQRFEKIYGVTSYDASVLASDRALADFFETAARTSQRPKQLANWVLNDLQSALATSARSITESPVSALQIDALTGLIDSGAINGKQGKEVFAEMVSSGKDPSLIVEEKGLKQESDLGAIEALCWQVIDANPKPVAEYKAGKTASINFLKGQVMKLSQGKANPAIAGDILSRLLSE